MVQAAKKKNVRTENDHFEFKTRGSTIMKPENQRLQKFNLLNFKKVETKLELQFMLQEIHSLIAEKMTSLGISVEEKSEDWFLILKTVISDKLNSISMCYEPI